MCCCAGIRAIVSHTDIVDDFAAAIEARASAFPEFADELRMFRLRWIETIGGPIEENVALLRRLRAAGRPVYALSNFAHETFALEELSQRYSHAHVSPPVACRATVSRLSIPEHTRSPGQGDLPHRGAEREQGCAR